jgi:excinuclease ABC subunit A
MTRSPGSNICDKVIDIDQSPIGRTPRSNPATYTGAFTNIRDWFAGLPEAQARGYKPGRFSFNVKGGRCEACSGDGLIKIEMHFLPDVYVTCEECHGKRYNRETLEVKFKGHEHRRRARHDGRGRGRVLQGRAADPRQDGDAGGSRPRLCQGRPAGDDAVGRRSAARETRQGAIAPRHRQTLYILDEPTTGLHFEDVRKLLEVLHALVDQGNSVVVIEHNLDVIKTADWILDLGPEGGVKGGEIVAQGTPEQVVKEKRSYTGHYLKPLLEREKAVAAGVTR